MKSHGTNPGIERVTAAHPIDVFAAIESLMGAGTGIDQRVAKTIILCNIIQAGYSEKVKLAERRNSQRPKDCGRYAEESVAMESI